MQDIRKHMFFNAPLHCLSREGGAFFRFRGKFFDFLQPTLQRMGDSKTCCCSYSP